MKYKIILITAFLFTATLWYNYGSFIEIYKGWVMSSYYGGQLIDEIGITSGRRVLMLPFVGLAMLMNLSLTATIIYTYFRGNMMVFKASIYIMLTYVSMLALGLLISHFFDLEYIYFFARQALKLIPSPLMEAILIPLMTLYMNSKKIEE